MRTKLEYTVLKEERYNFKKDRMENHVISRGFEFSVSGAKTKEEHERIIDSFGKFLEKNNVQYSAWGDGTWEYCKKYNDTQTFYYLYIHVEDMEDKEYIKELYKEWKANKREI